MCALLEAYLLEHGVKLLVLGSQGLSQTIEGLAQWYTLPSSPAMAKLGG
jgi:hypothetical protein